MEDNYLQEVICLIINWSPAMRQGGFKYGSYGFSGKIICKVKERYEVINPENNKANG